MNKYIHWFSVDAIPIPVKKKKFSKISGFARTGPYSDIVILDDSKFFSAAQSCFRNDVFYCSKQYRINVATLCCAKMKWSLRIVPCNITFKQREQNITAFHGQHWGNILFGSLLNYEPFFGGREATIPVRRVILGFVRDMNAQDEFRSVTACIVVIA